MNSLHVPSSFVKEQFPHFPGLLSILKMKRWHRLWFADTDWLHFNLICWSQGLNFQTAGCVFNENSDRPAFSVAANKCRITKTPKCHFKPPEQQKFKAKGVPGAFLTHRTGFLPGVPKINQSEHHFVLVQKHILFCSSPLLCHFFCSYDYIRLTYWFFCFICQTAEDTISTIIRLFGFSRRFLSAEPIFHSKIFKQPSKSWSRDDQAWMCPGWLRASSAARCPRRAAAITCLRTWRWSRRRRSSSCCCSSSSWPCSSYAVFASCWTRTAACPHPTGQTTLRRTLLITASSEESCGCTNWRKKIRNKKLIWC